MGMSTVDDTYAVRGYEAVMDDVECRVLAVLRKLATDMGFDQSLVQPEASLVDDMGCDSFRFVDLTLSLEKALEISEFPLHVWADAEGSKSDRRFTVRSLVKEVQRVVLAEKWRGL